MTMKTTRRQFLKATAATGAAASAFSIVGCVAGPNVVVRQALWVGVFAATVAWLLYGRVFSLGLAAIFLVGFTGIEAFLRLWERSRWRQP